jgi:hypothetical protein
MDRGDGTSEPLYVRVICVVKEDETMGLVLKLESIRINTKSPKFFLMLSQISIHKEWCHTITSGLLVCLTRMGGPS